MPLPRNFNLYICGADEVQHFRDKDINVALTFTQPGSIFFPDYTGIYSDDSSKFALHEFFFHDAWPGDAHSDALRMPSVKDIERIITIAKDIQRRLKDGEKVNVLCQCAAGISRSTAAAYIILCVLLEEWGEREAWSNVRYRREIARPNPFMVLMADEALKRQWKMIAPIKACVDFATGYNPNKHG